MALHPDAQAKDYEERRLVSYVVGQLRKAQAKQEREEKKAKESRGLAEGSAPCATLTDRLRTNAFPNLTWDNIRVLLQRHDISPDANTARMLKKFNNRDIRANAPLRYRLVEGGKLMAKEEVQQLITPEMACAYESLRAGLVRLEVRQMAGCGW